MPGGGSRIVVLGIDLVRRGHDLGAAPGLVDTDVADDIGRLDAAITVGRVDDAVDGAVGAWRSRAKQRGEPCSEPLCIDRKPDQRPARHVNDLRGPALFGRDRRRHAVAELRGISPHPPTGVAGIFVGR